ncbi:MULTISPECIES: hypothetical protein [Burkholderia]|nr:MULTISPECIES: hypothetical protein [Burkholderia]
MDRITRVKSDRVKYRKLVAIEFFHVPGVMARQVDRLAHFCIPRADHP